MKEGVQADHDVTFESFDAAPSRPRDLLWLLHGIRVGALVECVCPPQASWIAPSTPPPPINRELAALTIASASGPEGRS